MARASIVPLIYITLLGNASQDENIADNNNNDDGDNGEKI